MNLIVDRLDSKGPSPFLPFGKPLETTTFLCCIQNMVIQGFILKEIIYKGTDLGAQ